MQDANHPRNTIHGRFVLLVALIFGLLVGIAFYLERQATSNLKRTHSIGVVQQAMSDSLTEFSENLNLLWVTVYQASFTHEYTNSNTVENTFHTLTESLTKLQHAAREYPGNTLYESTQALKETLQLLERQIQTLLDVQADVEKRYPAMPIMLNELRPTNVEFSSALVDALNESRLDAGPEQTRIYELLRDLRYVWSQLISSVRVFVANRLGAFGPPRESMEASENNHNIYADTVRKYLGELKDLGARGKLGFVQEMSLQRMEKLFALYEASFERAAAIYYSETWRADSSILRYGIDPLLDKATNQLAALKTALERESTHEISEVAATTNTLSEFIWLMVGLVTALLALGYLAFEHIIRKPIIQISHALDAEGRGQSYEPEIRFHTRETHNLLAAFADMKKQVRSRQTRLQAILDNAGEGIVTFNGDGDIESFNVTAEELFGFKPKIVQGKPIISLIKNNDLTEFVSHHALIKSFDDHVVDGVRELVGVRRTGEQLPVSVRLGEMQLDGTTVYVMLVSDVSERKAMLDRLTELAERDSLTGLHNRLFLMEELDRIVERANRNEQNDVALLYLDLDNFKYVNDTLGHMAGDKVLVEVTEILEKRARGTDLLARLGGDEFAILLYGVDDKEARVAAEAYRKQLAEYVFRHEGSVVDIGCSIGVALLDSRTRKKEELLAQADLACHIAKRGGRNRVHVYQAVDRLNAENMSADMGWARRIKDSIENNMFVTACQPIMNVRTRKVVSQEILLRMKDNNGQLIMPAGFLPSAERFGLCTEIDRWVIRHSLRNIVKSQKHRLENFSINLSANSICDHSILNLIEDEVDRQALDPTGVIFEVTETGAIGNLSAAQKFLARLRKIGFKTALDDFGVGYSSFSYLKDLPVDYVKIDGSFIRDVAQDRVKRAIVASMNDVAHALGAQTVAEFVEDQATYDFLHEIQVDFCQGHFIGAPGLVFGERKDNVVYLH